ncbi:MAG TPA: DUF3592 domain-containing protein [Usitatibacter sp.]|nr:DUF3592 domain-containing protein [Usitatibacter sp.]
MSKFGAALFCLVFAIPFGGVGIGASWVLGRMVYDGHRAEEWVRVAAKVDSYEYGSVSYRYKFRGVEYRGDRLGANPIGGTDNLDSWHDDMAAMIGSAHDADKPITVWVNPDHPSESMVDRAIRWKLAVFMVPFALAFGGAGFAAAWMFFRTLFMPSEEVKTKGPMAAANKLSVAAFLWIFAFMWNAISFPVGLIVIPDEIAKGQWGVAIAAGLFPLVGVLLLLGAIAATIKRMRRKATRARTPPTANLEPRNDGVFARRMIGDLPAAAQSPAVANAALIEIEKLSGMKLNARQREALARLSPEQRENATKIAAVLGKIEQEN